MFLCYKFATCKLTNLVESQVDRFQCTFLSLYVCNMHLHFSLLTYLFQRAFESHCCRLDFAVLNWNPAQDFYKAKGAVNITEEEGWHHYRLDREALAKLALEVNKADVTNE